MIIRSVSNSEVDPYFNVALDHAYLELAAKKRLGPTIRIWRNSPSVIIGRIQDIHIEVNLPFCKDNNIPVIRRVSGGGTVYHDLGNINTSFLFPISKIPGEKNVQAFSSYFTQQIANILRGEGFEGIEIEGDTNVFYQGKKISGSAGHMKQGWFLHHATLLVSTDLNKLNGSILARESYPKDSKRSRYFPTINLEGLSLTSWLEACTAHFGDQFGLPIEKKEINHDELEVATFLVDNMYRTNAWNFEKKRTLINIDRILSRV